MARPLPLRGDMIGCLLVLTLLASTAPAQTPADSWRTVSTEHYRIHYPLQTEDWALDVAARMEAFRSRVVEEVGYDLDRVVDVVVEDPYALSNGMAIPTINSPRMVLWVTPPGADSGLGHYRSWAEDLVVHEDTHLVHLTRPTRNPSTRWLTSGLLGVGPIAMKSPLWLIEGYATLVEGRLTGFGRPNSDLRAALLRRWARDGQLPGFGELSGSDRWMGRSVPYLVGSAFLEWLEVREDPGALRDLWARMSARKSRGFDRAFEGVFGERAPVLYRRFCAELTHAAMDIEQQRPVDQDVLWHHQTWTTGAPAVSDDGERLAAVVRSRTGPSRLVVWPTEPDSEAEQEWREAQEALLAKDPEDVADVPPEVFPSGALHTRVRAARPAHGPRWNGDAILFSVWMRTADGSWLPDLVQWEPETGRERRITRGGAVVDPDPHPDGSWAVAVRQRWGSTQLVRIDLEDGDIEPLTPARADAIVDHPRFDPAGNRIAYLRHDGRWRLVVREVESGAEQLVPTPAGSTVASPAWTADGERLLVALGRDGFVEVHALGLDGELEQLTQSAGAGLAPEPSPDGASLYYLSLHSTGLDLSRLELADAQQPAALDFESVAPAVTPPPPAAPPLPEPVPTEAEAYGLGRLEWRPLVGGIASPHGGASEFGLRLGDLVGRSELLALGAWGDGVGLMGGGAAWAWRGLPIEVEARGFAVLRDPVGRVGGSLGMGWDRAWHWGGMEIQAGGFADGPLAGDPEGGRGVGYAGLELAHRWALHRAWVEVHPVARGRLGLSSGEAWQHGEAAAAVRLGVDGGYLELAAGAGRTTGTGLDAIRLGGVESAIVPEPWLWGQAALPVVGLDQAVGSHHDHLSARLRLSSVFGLVGERHRVWEECAGCETAAATFVGLEMQQHLAGQPLVRVPGLQAHFAIGCLVEDPEEGLDRSPCQELADYRGWMELVWRP